MEKIAVIMPVYNAENYLSNTIQSVLDQTYTNFEIICVNDGSTDKSLKILEDFKKIDNRITIINQENQGGSSARNTALNYIFDNNNDIKYISFLDNDDIYHKQYLEILYNNLKKTNSDLSMCYPNPFFEDRDPNFKFLNTYNINDIKIRTILKYPFFDKLVMRKKVPMLMWCKLAKKELYKNIRFPLSIPALNDHILVWEVLYNSKRACITDEKLIGYRIRNTSQTFSKKQAKKIDEFYYLIEEMNIFYKNHKMNIVEKIFFKRLTNKLTYFIFIRDRIRENNFYEFSNIIYKNLIKLRENGYFNPYGLNIINLMRYKKYFKILKEEYNKSNN